MKVVVVIAAYNVSSAIEGVLADLDAHGYTDRVVVDDCSRDDTYTKATAHRGTVVLRHSINRGQGAALETGDTYARRAGADIVVHFDGDGQMQVKDIKGLLEPLEKNTADIVFGSRYLGVGNDTLPWLKRYVYLPIGRVVNAFFTGLWLSDAHCGFRAFNAKVLHELVITQDRMAHATEILEKISAYNWRYKEVAVDIQYHRFGQGLRGINGALRTVLDLIKARIIR